MDLRTFFRSLPPPILARFRQRFVEEGTAGDPADALAELFADRHWLRGRLKGLSRSHHVALIALLQCRGVVGGTWLLQELTQGHGMSEDLWAEILHELGNELLVFGNSHQSPPLFYVLPDPLGEQLEVQFRKRLGLETATEEEQAAVRPSTVTNYRHPVGFSIVSFLTWVRGARIRVTREGELFKKNLDETLDFFRSLWGEGLEDKVLAWHLDFLREVGLLRHRGGFLEVDDLALEEFLGMEPAGRREVYWTFFVRREPLLGWLLETMAALPAGTWVPLPQLRRLYRRRYMGEVFHRRYVRKSYYLPPSGFYDPSPPLELVQIAGLVESGLGAKGSYVRLSEAGRLFVSGDGFESVETSEQVKYLVQGNFEVLAPVGLPMRRLWDLGRVAELIKVDRANTYRLSRDSVRAALDDGLRLDPLVKGLKAGSQVGLQQNVESTLRDWAGRHGEIELHDALVLTMSADRAAAVQKKLGKAEIPFTALGEGVLAVPRERQAEILEALRKADFEPAPHVRRYDLADAPEQRRGAFVELLAEPEQEEDEEEATFPVKSLVALGAPTAEGGREVMAQRGARAGRVGANAVGADLSLKPAAAGAGDLQKLSPAKTMALVRAAIRLELDLDVLYPSTGPDDKGGLGRVTPKDVKDAGGASYFVGHHHRLDQEIQFHIKRVQGIRLAN